MWYDTDLRAVLPLIRVPCLLLVDSPDDRHLAKAEHAAALIPDAAIVLVPNDWPTPATMNEVLGPPVEAVRRFAGLEPTRKGLDSVLASVLFTDIVGSTQRQAAMGDHAWKDLVERHHELVRDALAQWRGVENDTAGDGFYATFDGPARAIRCALEISARVRELGIEIRAGVHTGECEVVDGKAGGITVSIGARISALAATLPGVDLPDRQGSRRRVRLHPHRRGRARARRVCPTAGMCTPLQGDRVRTYVPF